MAKDEIAAAMDGHLVAIDILLTRLLADAAMRDATGSIADLVRMPEQMIESIDAMPADAEMRALILGSVLRLLRNADTIWKNETRRTRPARSP